jgi:ribosomal protein L35
LLAAFTLSGSTGHFRNHANERKTQMSIRKLSGKALVSAIKGASGKVANFSTLVHELACR